MGIEDPIWGKVIIVLFFITILLGALYFSKYRGKEFFSKLSNNEFLKLEETYHYQMFQKQAWSQPTIKNS